MYKLMRRALILTTLCLILVVTPALNQKAKAAGTSCAVAQAFAAAAYANSFATCADSRNSTQQCLTALNEAVAAEAAAVQACSDQ